MALRGAPATKNMKPSFSMEREPPNQILSEIRQKILAKGIFGITDFVNLFNRYAVKGFLGRAETQWCLRENGQRLSEQETERIFKYFDKNGDGLISIHEFIEGVRGSLNTNRSCVVAGVWAELAPEGKISTSELAEKFNLESSSDYKLGRKTGSQIVSDMMSQIDQDCDNSVDTDEFRDFYTNVSVSFENDLVFEKFVRD